MMGAQQEDIDEEEKEADEWATVDLPELPSIIRPKQRAAVEDDGFLPGNDNEKMHLVQDDDGGDAYWQPRHHPPTQQRSIQSKENSKQAEIIEEEAAIPVDLAVLSQGAIRCKFDPNSVNDPQAVSTWRRKIEKDYAKYTKNNVTLLAERTVIPCGSSQSSKSPSSQVLRSSAEFCGTQGSKTVAIADGEGVNYSTNSSAHVTGCEGFIVGISPSFWAHVPLTIRQISELKLIEGIHCILQKNLGEGSPSPCTEHAHILPVSKCCLVGTVVAMEQQQNRFTNTPTLFVLDDGTGLIDCLLWKENEAYLLPSLTDEDDDEQGGAPFAIGQMMRVFGRIECVAIHSDLHEITLPAGRKVQVKSCTREIHANRWESLGTHLSLPGSLDVEAHHWLQVSKGMSSYPNAAQILDQHLGPVISNQVAQKSYLPSASDKDGAWKLFGINCNCQTIYKENLLYCFCLATADSLDANLKFRHILLERLIQLEEKQQDKNPFRFQYSDVAEDAQIWQAYSVEANRGLNTQDANLMQRAFAALRRDGILYLLDAASDTYLLISRRKVLEPYVTSTLSLAAGTSSGKQFTVNQDLVPSFLSNVPRVRLDFVRRSLLHSKNKMGI